MNQNTLSAYAQILKEAQEKALNQSAKKPTAPKPIVAEIKPKEEKVMVTEESKPIFAFRQPFDLSRLIKQTSASPELSDVTIDDIIGEDKPQSDIAIVHYSDKCVVVIGNTKPKKDSLKALGGKFNPYLKCGEGWVFPKHKEAEIRDKFTL